MFYLISGKILSFIVFVIIVKLFNSFSDLILVEKIIGWFFIDHIFEEYNFTSGKFFLVNEDYRDLIKNLVALCVFLWFFAQQFIVFEFFFIFSIFVVSFFIQKSNKKLFIVSSYVFLFFMVLVLNFNIIQFTTFLCVIFICTVIYCKFFMLLFLRGCSNYRLKQFIVIFSLKSILFLFFLAICLLCFPWTSVNNFVVEGLVQMLMLYTYYIYYF